MIDQANKPAAITLRIAILGTRGIPNRYGGFEQVAACLSAGLVELGHEVTVYNPATHPYTDETWHGVKIIRCYAPPGTAGQFVYDLACTLDARKRNFHVWLILGYTSSSVWGWLYPKKNTVLISNMDGLEWKRSKYNAAVRKFLQWAEQLAVRYSHFLVADSLAIQSYLREKYQLSSKYIAYGAEIHQEADEQALTAFGLQKNNYALVIARMEPENNIEMIIEGFIQSGTTMKLLVIGNIENRFGKKLRDRFTTVPGLVFAQAIYDQPSLTALKKYCRLYLHGHSCGGTNPSLLEAMAGSALVCAHNNAFNRAVLGEDALYFSTASDIAAHLCQAPSPETAAAMTGNNLARIRETFNWPAIVSQYERFMQDCYNSVAV